MILKSETPIYGKNYRIGYIGFQFTSDSLLSNGVAYFARWDRMSDIRVSHCFVVVGANQGCEALADKNKVSLSDLSPRFNDPHCLVFFRQPRGWTLGIGADIAKTAKGCVGDRYDRSLIAGHLAVNLWLVRRLMSKGSHRQFEDWFLKKCDSKEEWICSELCAYALDEQEEYRDKGVLARPNYCVKPQALFEDQEIFEPWKEGVGE